MRIHKNNHGRWLVLGRYFLTFQLFKWGFRFFLIKRATKKLMENVVSFSLGVERDSSETFTITTQGVLRGWVCLKKKERGFRIYLNDMEESDLERFRRVERDEQTRDS